MLPSGPYKVLSEVPKENVNFPDVNFPGVKVWMVEQWFQEMLPREVYSFVFWFTFAK